MFECHITNGITNTGLAIRHFGYSLLENPKRIATAGMIKRSEKFDKEIVNYYQLKSLLSKKLNRVI